MKSLSIIYITTPFILIVINLVTFLTKNSSSSLENKITFVKNICTFSLFFGILNFFASFLIACYSELYNLNSIEEIKIVKNQILINAFNTAIISPVLGSLFFFVGELFIKKMKLKSRTLYNKNNYR
jgi:hypothetical protein